MCAASIASYTDGRDQKILSLSEDLSSSGESPFPTFDASSPWLVVLGIDPVHQIRIEKIQTEEMQMEKEIQISPHSRNKDPHGIGYDVCKI